MIIYLFQISLLNHFLNVLISLQMSRSFVNFAVHHIDINKQLLFIPRYANWSHVVINNRSFATTNCRNFLQGVSFLLKRNKNYFNLYARSAKDWFFSRESEFSFKSAIYELINLEIKKVNNSTIYLINCILDTPLNNKLYSIIYHLKKYYYSFYYDLMQYLM